MRSHWDPLYTNPKDNVKNISPKEKQNECGFIPGIQDNSMLTNPTLKLKCDLLNLLI